MVSQEDRNAVIGWLVIFVMMVAGMLLTGCATRGAHVKAPANSLVIPRECITSVKLEPGTYCFGPDKQHLDCRGIELTIITGCGIIKTGEHK